MFDALARLRVPLIAVLNGHALGGGLELAATADIRIAESHVRIGLPEPTLGMVPGWSGTQRLVRRFGSQAVRRMSLGAEMFSAREALGLGLVDFVAETGAGMNEARARAARIAASGPIAIETVKLLINAAEQEEIGRCHGGDGRRPGRAHRRSEGRRGRVPGQAAGRVSGPMMMREQDGPFTGLPRRCDH